MVESTGVEEESTGVEGEDITSKDKSYQHNHLTLHMLVTYPMILYRVTLTPFLRT